MSMKITRRASDKIEAIVQKPNYIMPLVLSRKKITGNVPERVQKGKKLNALHTAKTKEIGRSLIELKRLIRWMTYNVHFTLSFCLIINRPPCPVEHIRAPLFPQIIQQSNIIVTLSRQHSLTLHPEYGRCCSQQLLSSKLITGQVRCACSWGV